MNTPSNDVSLSWILRTWLSRPTWTIGVPIVSAALAVVVSLFVRPMYTSVASFVPETRGAQALNPALLGLASQFGVTLGGQAAVSPHFYADVLKSREVLEDVLRTRFAVPGHAPGDSASLLDLLKIRGGSEGRRLERGVKKLADLIAVDVDTRTSIVRFAVDAPGRDLAQEVGHRLLVLLNDFNLSRRQSQARQRRRFVEQRLAAADSALMAAENRLRSFYETNRQWQNSPMLSFEEARLRRELTLRQELQLTLARELETARIEEVNDTPVLTVIDQPSLPQRKSSPKRAVIAVAALIVGGIVGSAGAFAAEAWREFRASGHPDYLELELAWRELRSHWRRGPPSR